MLRVKIPEASYHSLADQCGLFVNNIDQAYMGTNISPAADGRVN